MRRVRRERTWVENMGRETRKKKIVTAVEKAIPQVDKKKQFRTYRKGSHTGCALHIIAYHSYNVNCLHDVKPALAASQK